MFTVGEVTGEVRAVAPDGSSRIVREGDSLLPGETLEAEEGAQAILLFPDGRQLALPAGGTLTLPATTLSTQITDLTESDQSDELKASDDSETIANSQADGMLFPDISSSGFFESGPVSYSADSPNHQENTPAASGQIGGGSSGPIAGLGSTPTLARDGSLGNSLDSGVRDIGYTSSRGPVFSQSSDPGISSGLSTVSSAGAIASSPSTAANSPIALSEALASGSGASSNTTPIISHPTIVSSSATGGAVISSAQVQTAVSSAPATTSTPSTAPQQTSTQTITPASPSTPEPAAQQATPTPTPEPVVAASTTADTGSVVFGQSLVQQSGLLSNDQGTGITLSRVGDTDILETGSTTIQGQYGSLSIQADGMYNYTAASVDLHSDMVAHWAFNESVGSASVQDSSIMDSVTDTGTLNNNASIVSGGRTGNALQLDGTGDYVSFADSVEINTPTSDISARTISLFFQPDSATSLSDRQVIYEEGGTTNGFIIYIQSNTLYAGAYSSSTGWTGHYFSTDISNLDTSQWHSIVLSLDASTNTMEAWLDGASIGEISNAQAVASHASDIRLGGSGDGNLFHDGEQTGAFNFNGKIDEVRVYNRALNEQEVSLLHSGNTSATEIFNYTATDSAGGTSSSTLTLTVSTPSNISPVAVDDVLSVMSDQSAAINSVAGQGLLGNDRDAEGDSLTVTRVGTTDVAASGTTSITGTYGTLVIAANGTYSYTPLNSAANGGTDTFTYTVSDGTTTSTANLTVNVIADGSANADTLTVTESGFSASAVYMLDETGGQDYLAVVDTESGVSHRLGAITGSSASRKTLAMGPDGTLYVTDSTNLYTLDPSTQALTLVGAHGVTDSMSFIGLTVAPDGTIYAAKYDGHIYTLNPSTGAATDLGGVSGFENNWGDLVWHDGALYTQAYTYTNGQSIYQFVRIEPSNSGFTATPLPNASDAGSLHGITSVNGELRGVVWSYTGGETVTIDTTTGLVSSRAPVTGAAKIEDSASSGTSMAGNVLTNDTGTTGVTTVALPDGTSSTVSNGGATIQGTYGTLIMQTDGSYIYTLDNSLEATNNLASEETGTDRFVYTASTTGGSTQSILTVFVNGSSEVVTTDAATFSNYNVMTSVDASSSTIPIDFTITTQNDSDKITEIVISGVNGSTFNVPSVLTDNGTITGNTSNSSEFVWRATPGTNAGLDSFDAASAGLTLATINGSQAWGQHMGISATVSEYDSNGATTSSWTSTSAIHTTLAGIDHTRTGTSGDDTLTGSSDTWTNIDEFIGGAGNDTMTGGSGSDFYVWRGADVGTSSSPAIDTITDFSAGRLGDVLDLRELLPDTAESTLDEFLSFSFADGNTTIGVSTTAGGPVVQNIVLDNVDLSSSFGTTDVTQLTNQLTDNGNLLT
ncbi:VCBS domain-containing protein [Parendozoicomonas haliclonae]|uniref:Uncharacterized protein n=1 Tax=Parendozoicomonas haliclonae TaxID=1960125 RepID=A0A1X7AIX0_9GAMM|nr:VCBS domain-containing protein [Parendozoicomonas haliclonae]SMA45859.1 hypothetical protein EHSB41UT_02012 [Parendozoicomonas haliclonae]